ncbi:MAG: amidohydrolase family protein [Litorilinea sp.]
MRDQTIYNCHVHILTRDHAPRHTLKLLFDDTRLGRLLGPRIGAWLGVALSEVAHYGWFPQVFKYVARWLAYATGDDVWEREARFLDVGNQPSQAKVLAQIQCEYPEGTRFVVLPMDMTHAKLGPLTKSIERQHEELVTLAKASEGTLLPFYAVDPRHANFVADARRHLASGNYHGVKLYPSLGYKPDDEALFPIYELCESKNLPVMTHCSTGGVWEFGLNQAQRADLGHPRRYKKVLQEFPRLRICLAHFGGGPEWLRHLRGPEKGADTKNDHTIKGDRKNRAGETDDDAWIKIIGDMIRGDTYPNLYTDISYIAFAPRLGSYYFDFFDYLKVLLSNEKLRQRVLFGSDFYMVQRERLSEKEVSITLRSRLGEDLYFQIANVNPKHYLGLEPQPSP